MTKHGLIPFIKTVIVFFLVQISNFTYGQEADSLLEKLRIKDSIASRKAKKAYGSNVVSSEIHNIFFRNIYRSKSNNEEKKFKSEKERLKKFENRIIDSIIIVQLNAFGESVYDSTIRSNKFEVFLSSKIHTNTKIKVLRNRFLLFKKYDNFSFYKAMENSRLIRNSGILHDMRIEPIFYKSDNSHILLKYIIQDVFPYDASVDFSSFTDYGVGLENVNFLGLAHKIGVECKINTEDRFQKVGYAVKYQVPNFWKKQFVNLNMKYQNFSRNDVVSIGSWRNFSRPEFRWAGGVNAAYYDQLIENIAGNFVKNKRLENEAWFSYSFPFNTYNKTVNSLILGTKYQNNNHFERPMVSTHSNSKFWNKNLVLFSLGFSRYGFKQERLLNGYGRTEDIPDGYSINGLFGYDYTEFGTRQYAGFQFITQHYTKNDIYINTGFKIGTYLMKARKNPAVVDFETQSASPIVKMGNFRLRNYFKARLTVGFNQDSTDFLRFNDYDGVRSEVGFTNRGDSRLTAGFQSNLFLPFSFLGFRYSVFALGEVGKIQYGLNEMFKSPVLASVNVGISFKNENLIFDLFQLQYSLASSSDLNINRGILFTSVLPFRLINLDISRPRTIDF